MARGEKVLLFLRKVSPTHSTIPTKWVYCFIVMWIVITASAAYSVVNGRVWSSVSFALDIWFLQAWSRNIYRRRKFYGRNWRTSPDHLHRTLRGAGFSEQGARLLTDRITSSRVAISEDSRADARATAAAYADTGAREGAGGSVGQLVLGVKMVMAIDGCLHSGHGMYHWEPGINTASCPYGDKQGELVFYMTPTGYVQRRFAGSHPQSSIHPYCTCGFYSYDLDNIHLAREWPSVDRSYPAVFALLALYGETYEHTLGYRSEKAEIIGVIAPEKLAPAIQSHYPNAVVESV